MNLSYYKLDNVIPICKAAGARKGKIKLYETFDPGGTSILPPLPIYKVDRKRFFKWYFFIKNGLIFKLLRERICMRRSTIHFVSVDTLDNIVNECGIDKVDLIKIDVEGTELELLRGSLNLLRKHKPVLLIEVHYGFGWRPQEIYDLLEGYGYSLTMDKRPAKTLVVARVPEKP
jgi:FkbM family methyltransferase